MTGSQKFAFLGMTLAVCAFALPAGAQSVSRLPSANPAAPIVSAVSAGRL